MRSAQAEAHCDEREVRVQQRSACAFGLRRHFASAIVLARYPALSSSRKRTASSAAVGNPSSSQHCRGNSLVQSTNNINCCSHVRRNRLAAPAKLSAQLAACTTQPTSCALNYAAYGSRSALPVDCTTPPHINPVATLLRQGNAAPGGFLGVVRRRILRASLGHPIKVAHVHLEARLSKATASCQVLIVRW